MTPRKFLEAYQFDERLVRGGFYSHDALSVEEGDTVGVVMMNLGGPDALDDVEPFLYNLFMDPALIDIPLGNTLRHWFCRAVAYFRAQSVAEDYEKIGGSSPVNRLTREQARDLEQHLNGTYGRPAGVEFRTYMAMRYWHPSSEKAAAQMKADGVDKVVLLPLYPHWSKTTSGSSTAYWKALDEAGDIPSWPTTNVYEYAANPKYVQAVSERIDEGLQRFPANLRSDVHLVFSAHGTPQKERTTHGDPYCCLVHTTVEEVMRARSEARPFHSAFQTQADMTGWLSPSTASTITELAEKGVESVLVVPIGFVTDHVETNCELDIKVREQAEAAGIRHYEVSSGLNAHPLFLEALAEATVSQLQLPVDGDQLRFVGDGVGGSYPLQPVAERPTFSPDHRKTRCSDCECVAEAHRWDADLPKPEVSSARDTDSSEASESNR